MAEHELNKIVDDEGEVFNLRDSTKQPVADRVTAWGSTPSDTKYPSEKLVKASLDAISTNARTIPQDVSKGANLVVNGSGVMGNNYNWYACSFNANTDLPEGVAGCFHRSGGDFFQEEKIAINTSKSYIVESWYRVKTANTSTVRLTVACYDVDAKSISAIYSTYGVGTLTQLTEDLKPGDTVVHLADLSNSNWKSATNFHHGFIFWNYKNSYGYQYPPETYSRNVYPSSGTVYLWTNASQVDQTNNTITLDSAWSGPSIPAGTYVSRRNSGSTYYYAKTSAASGALTTWTKLSGFVKGFVTPGGTDGGCFRPGTAFIRIGWVNANTGGNEWFEFAGCELREIPEQISGTLPVANGGTGKTSVTSGNYLVGAGTSALTEKTSKQVGNNVLPALDAGTDNVLDTDYIIASNHTSGATDATTFVRRTAGKLWNYIKGQISSVLGLSENGYTGNSATATTAAGYTSGGAIDTALQGKVDKETGKGLSTNDFTNTYKSNVDSNTSARHTHSNKSVLDDISSTDVDNWNAAEPNVQSDWNQTDTSADDYIKNKPSAVMWLTYDTSYTNEQISGWLASGYLLCVSYVSKVYVYAKGFIDPGSHNYLFVDAQDYAYLRASIGSSTCTWSEGDNYPAYVKYLEGTVSSARDTMTVSKDSSNQTVVSSGDGTTAAKVYIRPKGHTAADNQFVVHEDGSISLNNFHSRFGYIEHHYNVANEKVIRFGFSRTASNVAHRDSCIRLQYARNVAPFEVRIAINISDSGTLEGIGATVTVCNSVISVNAPKVYSYSNANWHWVFVAFSRGDANIDHYLNWEYSGENSDGLNVTLVEAVHSDASAVPLRFIPIGNVNVDSGSFTGIGSATRPVYVNSSGQIVECNIFYA